MAQVLKDLFGANKPTANPIPAGDSGKYPYEYGQPKFIIAEFGGQTLGASALACAPFASSS